MRLTDYPEWVCDDCGNSYGRQPASLDAEWHLGTCHVCGNEGSVANPREFGHLTGECG